MRMLTILVVLITVVASVPGCGAPSEVETDGTHQASQELGTINYRFAGVRVARSSSQTWATNVNGGGAFASRVYDLTYGQISAQIVYPPVVVLTNPASVCNGDYLHDEVAVLAYGLAHIANPAQYRGYWLVGQEPVQGLTPDLAPECNLDQNQPNAGFPLCGNSIGAASCSSLGLPSDSFAIIGHAGLRDCDSPVAVFGGCDGSSQLVHEWLHSQPTLYAPNDSFNFVAGHDGSLFCASAGTRGTYNWSPATTGCVPSGSVAPQNYLSYTPSGDPSQTLHRDAENETVENKRLDYFYTIGRSASAFSLDWPVANQTLGSSVTTTLRAHDTNTLTPDSAGGYYELRVGRPDGRVVYFEFRQNEWTGCRTDRTHCGEFNAPGVYAWVIAPDTNKYMVRWCGSSPFYWNGFCPLETDGAFRAIEPGMSFRVTSSTPTSALLTVTFTQ